MKNYQSAVRNAQFVSQSIQDLVYGNCVIECVKCPLVCSPLQVVTSAKGKQQLVINLRYVNQYLHQHKFKYEGLNVLPSLFHQGDFMITFDLKSGYHHVDINQDCWPYLGFSWKDPRGVRRFYMFRVLPFGLSTACYVFTKLLRPLVKLMGGEPSSILMMVFVLHPTCGKLSSIVLPFSQISPKLGLFSTLTNLT